MIILNVDGETSFAGFIGDVCRGPSIDMDGLVGGAVIGRTCSHFEKIFVCHSSCKWAITSPSNKLISSLLQLQRGWEASRSMSSQYTVSG